MSNLTNLAPGETVPKTGTYVCIFCTVRRTLSQFALGIPDPQGPSDPFDPRGNTVKFFRAGEKFDYCPKCGKGTGWTFRE